MPVAVIVVWLKKQTEWSRWSKETFGAPAALAGWITADKAIPKTKNKTLPEYKKYANVFRVERS